MDTLTVSHVKKSFGSQEIIRDLSFRVPEHSVFGFIGENGAGKTTTMKMILGLLRMDGGEILVEGEAVCYGQTRTNRYVGYLPDVPEYYGFMTPREYLRLCAEVSGITRKEADKRADELLEMVGLTKADKRIHGFSRGMKQRLGIAQALLGDPEILVLDEPTAGLDPEERIRFRGIISDLSQQKLVLLSTHIVSDLEAVANEIILLRKGVVLEMQKPASLLEQLNGQVWLVTVPAADEAALTKQYTCSNVMHTDGKSVIRLLSESAPRPDAVPTAPNMEDLYLYYFGR